MKRLGFEGAAKHGPIVSTEAVIDHAFSHRSTGSVKNSSSEMPVPPTRSVRVEDEEQSYVFCTHRIGHMIDGTTPQMQFDTSNNLYILHLVAPKTYFLTNIGVNGEWLGQHTYNAPKARPALRRLADGTIQIVGGHRMDVATRAPGAPPAVAPPKLSDRPAGLPAN